MKREGKRFAMLTHSYADVNEIRLHYVTAGKGKLILFVHGFPECWYEWKDQLVEFEKDYQAVALDMRGYNLSSKPASVEQYQMSCLVQDLSALAQHLGHHRCILVGHDWGGAAAWAFAMRHPEALEKLVIVNAPHPTIFRRERRENPAQQQASSYMQFFRSTQAEQLLSANTYQTLVQATFGEDLWHNRFTQEDRNAYLQAWSQPGALTASLKYYRSSGPQTPERQQASPVEKTISPGLVTVPTLVIWGERDPFFLVGNLEGLEQLVPQLRIKRISDGTHWVVHEEPTLVNALLREFLQDQEPLI